MAWVKCSRCATTVEVCGCQSAVASGCSAEKCVEYQQVAGLVCLDLYLLHTVSKRKDITLDELREHIEFTIEKKDDAINNAESRKMRYQSCAMLLNLPRATDT